MIQFKISAPGKIVLSGDHAVMNKEKNVVMASLDLRTKLKFCELPDEQEIVKIELSKIDLSLNVPLEIVRNFSLRNDMKDMYSNTGRLLRYVKNFITVNGMWRTPEQRISLNTFFVLLLSSVYTDKLKIRSFYVCVSTELPISGGLGSSTSFAVCLAACFIHWARLQKGAHDKFDEDDLEKIRQYTTICEEYIQDYAFEFDNIVCTYGKINKFKYINFENYTKQICQDMPANMLGMTILLIDTKICRNNRERLQQMAELIQIRPEIADYILHKIDAVSQKIFDTLFDMTCSTESPNSHQEDIYDQLKEHIQKNQQLFYFYDKLLSHPRLNDICSIVENYGFAGKLTGFGGGFVYIPLPPISPPERITELLKKKLLEKNCDITKTFVGCSGVRIHD
ncbi:mevalonate kinase [Lasius niger]|uniref:Mevalonate kinase n=1 Tax=Lasius niger TaxID=67767 RepID=A0A0J7K2W3_LASNI|nr:mevalonate kinase [Lasius niger]